MWSLKGMQAAYSYVKEKSKWVEKLRGVATEAARKAFAASAAEISELKIKNTALQEQESARIVELKTQLNNLKNQDIPRVSELETDVNILRQENVDLEKQVALGAATKDVAVQSATRALNSTIQQQSSALAVYQTKVSTMETAHAKEIATLKKKLKVSPNSWTEIAVSGKGRKRRTYVRRQHARFTDALGEYAKDVGKDVYFMQFEHKGIRVGGNETKTFEQLNIKDGDELRMHGG